MAINTTSVQARELLQQDYSQELAVKNAMGAAPGGVPAAGSQVTTGAAAPAAAAAAAVQPATQGTPGQSVAAPAQAVAGQVQTTAAAQTAQQQAAAAQQAEQETFNAPVLRLPARPTTHAVLRGLASAMAAPETNAATAMRLKEFHDQLFESEKAMIQVIVDGMR